MLLSNTPFPRNTIVQEKILTKALLQNGRMISRNSASRERPFIVFARTKAHGNPNSRQRPVTSAPNPNERSISAR